MLSRFMKGLELNRLFFEEVVRPIITTHYPHLRYSAARLGEGSDVLGYDDMMSTDHDWGLRFQLFLQRDDFIAHADEIRDLLARELPYTFRGYPTHFSPPDPADGGTQTLSAVTSGPVNHRITLHTLRSFVHSLLYFDIEQPLTSADWLTFPQQKLLSLAAGAVYYDAIGLAELRERFAYYPSDVWFYLLAAGWARISQEEHLMGRAGQQGDELGARLIAARLVRDCMLLAFLMARRYAPYAKWFGTAFGELDCAEVLQPLLMEMLSAETWQTREQHFIAATQHLVTLHNALGITPFVPEDASQFFGRPFRVITTNGIIPILLAQINDVTVQELLNKPLIGSIDQFSDNTDLVSNLRWRPILNQLYQ